VIAHNLPTLDVGLPRRVAINTVPSAINGEKEVCEKYLNRR
jgi:hypothetical protein